MKKKIITFSSVVSILALCFSGSLQAAKLGTLEGVFKPQMIKVYGDELFVVEGHTILIYSLKDLSLKKKIGKKGEGPGEFNPDPSRTIIMKVYPEFIVAESRNKVIFFGRDGKYLKEHVKTPGILQTIPIGKNYLIHKILYGAEGKLYFTANIYDRNMKDIKELYRQKFFTFESKVFVMPDPLHLCVWKDRVYVEESPGGLVIEAFDFQGNKVKRIEKEYDKLEVTEAHKKQAYNEYVSIPFIRRMIKREGMAAFKNFLKQVTLVYPDYFPAIDYMAADSGLLYLKTYYKKDGKFQFLVMNPEGKLVKKIYLPEAKKADFLVQMQGDKKFYTIHDGKYYYLKFYEEEDDERWDVHVEEIK